MVSYLILSLLIFGFGLFNLLGLQGALFRSQLIFGIVGLLVFYTARKIGLHFFRMNAVTLYWAFIVILILTYIIGIEVKGSKRWIDFYFFSFQASEFFKVFFMIFLADFFTRNRRRLMDMSFFLKAIGYFILPAFIVFKQPDLGNAIVYTAIFFVVALFSGVPKINVLKTVILSIIFVPLGWFFLRDYQRARILSFLNPHLDQGGNAYNMIQAIVTVGSGKFLGKGLGFGTQSGLFFLPENHTDFAYSSLVEQFGFIGGAAVIGLYLVFSYFLVRKIIAAYYGRSENDTFNLLFLLGFFAYFTTQVFVNIGMNMGLMPITGITLPLISYGGSSVITWMLAVALLP